MTEAVVVCCRHTDQQHSPSGCRGYNLAGGSRGRVQQCGCVRVVQSKEAQT